MNFKGRFRTVRHKDHAVPALLPRPLLGHSSCLDIRIWADASAQVPLLLVTSPKKTGPAVERNRFRRQVRMAFLAHMMPLLGRPCVVWVRPARSAPPLRDIRFQEIELQLQLALQRLSALGNP